MSVHWRAPLVAFVLILAPLAWAEPVPAPQSPEKIEAARAHFVLGEASYREGKWSEALAQFRAGYALDPRPEFLLNMAQTERRLGQIDQALADCKRFLAVAAGSRLDGQVKQLVGELEREQRKTRAQAAAAEGKARLAAGDPQGALAAYQRAYLDDIDEPSYLARLGDCYRALGRRAEALRFYRLYLHERPQAPERAAIEAAISALEAPASSSPIAPAAAALTAAPPDRRAKVWKRWWFWTSLAGAVAVGVGVGVGVGLWQRGQSAFQPTLPGFGPGGASSALEAR